MPDYTPKFPRTVSGQDYRLPLHHPDVEAVGARLACLYESVSLKPHHRAQALRGYADLVIADDGIWNCMGDTPIEGGVEAGELRPKRPILPEVEITKRVHHVMSDDDKMIPIPFPELRFGALIGFVARVNEWCARLENAYGATAYRRLGEIAKRDAAGNPLPEDI